jgi:hypothetical protein
MINRERIAELKGDETVFDPRLGGIGGLGSRYRETKTGRFVAGADRKKRPREIMFRCKYCRESKPLDDMRTLTRYFPPLVACRECERKMG